MPLTVDDSSIISYDLEIDDGKGGAFTSVGGYSPYSMQTLYTISNLTTGYKYRLRYRVLNIVGWSNYSPTLFALVANVPSAP